MADTQTRCTPARRTLALYRRVFREAKPFRVHLGALLMPLPVTIAVDSVIGGKPLPTALAGWVPEGLVVATALFTQVHGLADRFLRDWTGQRMVARFRAKLFPTCRPAPASPR